MICLYLPNLGPGQIGGQDKAPDAEKGGKWTSWDQQKKDVLKTVLVPAVRSPRWGLWGEFRPCPGMITIAQRELGQLAGYRSQYRVHLCKGEMISCIF
jgi:hypothetical protein